MLITVRDIETNVVKRLTVSPGTTITQLKERIKSLFSVSCTGSIMFQGIDLREGTLSSNGVYEGCLIDIVGEVVGAGFRFIDMSLAIREKFSDSAPEWRVVQPGLSWKGTCKTTRCDAYDDKVIINQGFGVFVVEETRMGAVCPMCSRVVRDVNNCGFYKAIWRFWGKLDTDKEKRGEGRADTEDYTTFSKGKQVGWSELIIEVKPL